MFSLVALACIETGYRFTSFACPSAFPLSGVRTPPSYHGRGSWLAGNARLRRYRTIEHFRTSLFLSPLGLPSTEPFSCRSCQPLTPLPKLQLPRGIHIGCCWIYGISRLPLRVVGGDDNTREKTGPFWVRSAGVALLSALSLIDDHPDL